MRAITLILMLTLAGPAQALSCLRPDAVSLFERARDSEDSFYILKGRIRAIEPLVLPKASPNQLKGLSTSNTVRVEGLGLNDDGFTSPVSREITLNLSCLSMWCAGGPSEDELIMAIKVTRDALELEVGPCGGDVVNWDQDGEDRLLACQRSNTCQRLDDF